MQAPISPTVSAAMSRDLVERVRDAVGAFVRWLDVFGPVSQDPYDFWNTRTGGRIKARYHRGGIIGRAIAAPVVALDLVAPGTRRLARPRQRSAITDSHFAIGFFALARLSDSAHSLERARGFLEAVVHERSPDYDEPAWGYPFDWTTRYDVWPAGLPMITTIPYAYEALELGYESFGDAAYLELMEGTARFTAEQIPTSTVGDGLDASAYTPIDRRKVVNASAYRGFLLVTAGRRFDRQDWVASGRRNIAFVVASQRADGSWPYSVDGSDDFVDNFHTCFVLKNLLKVWTLVRDDDVLASFRRGYAFYQDRLLDDDGLPIPFAKRARLTLHRRDLYDYAEGINLAAIARDVQPAASDVLDRLVDDLTQRWQLSDGHFVTRELAVGRNTVPYHRWAQSQTFAALARLLPSDTDVPSSVVTSSGAA